MGTTNDILPFAIGQKSDSGVYAGLLGRHYIDDDGRRVKLVRANTAITSPASKAAVYVVTGGTYNNKVKLSSAANENHFAGVIDPALTQNLAADDFFFVYDGEGDVVDVIGATTGIAAGEKLGTITTTAGSLGEVLTGASTTAATISDLTALGNYVAKALEAPSSAGATIKAQLRGVV